MKNKLTTKDKITLENYLALICIVSLISFIIGFVMGAYYIIESFSTNLVWQFAVGISLIVVSIYLVVLYTNVNKLLQEGVKTK